MRNTLYFTVLVLCSVAGGGLRVHAATIGDADRQIAQALTSDTPSGVVSGLREAEKALVEANAAQKAATPSAAVSGRAHLIEGLLKAAELESAGDAIEAQRFFARSLSLSKSLSAVADPATGQTSAELAKAAPAIYRRMAQLGKPFSSSPVAYTLQKGEELLHRRFVSDGTTLKAYELAGNPSVPDAQWRQTTVGTASPAILDGLRKNLALASGGNGDAVAGGKLPQFVLLVGGKLGRASLAVEKELAALAGLASQRSGIAVTMATDPARLRPFRLLPGIAGEAGEDTARLIYTPTSSELGSWPAVSSVAELETITETAWGLRDAILRDFGQPSASDVDLAKITVKDALLEPPPAEPVAVAANTPAAQVNADKILDISPRSALRQTTVAGDGWSRFELDGGGSIWLRTASVGPYIEYPADETGSSLLGMFKGDTAAKPTSREVAAKSATVFARPDSTSRKLMMVPAKSKVTLVSVQVAAGTDEAAKQSEAARKEWAFVRYGDSAGWIDAALLAPVAEPPPTPKAEALDKPKPAQQ